MALSWLERFFPTRVPEPSAIQRYLSHLHENKEPTLETVQLLLAVFKAPEVVFTDDIQTRLNTELQARFKTIDNLVYALQHANAAMVQQSSIVYIEVLEKPATFTLDDYYVNNQGYPLHPTEVVSLVETCITLYAQQMAHYREIGRPDRASYYERVYALFFKELHQALHPLLNLRRP